MVEIRAHGRLAVALGECDRGAAKLVERVFVHAAELAVGVAQAREAGGQETLGRSAHAVEVVWRRQTVSQVILSAAQSTRRS